MLSPGWNPWLLGGRRQHLKGEVLCIHEGGGPGGGISGGGGGALQDTAVS